MAQNARDRLKASRQRVADAIADAMEGGGLSWQREWAGRWTPANAVTGTRYRGINRVALAAAGAALDTPDGRWLTYSQGRLAGWPVRRGEHSPASVEYWSRWCRTHDDKIVTERRARQLVEAGVEDEGILKSARLAPVVTPAFSSAQVEGIPAIPLADHSREDPSIADALVASSRCKIIEARSDSAFYSPADDTIVMPRRGQFRTLSGYVRVLSHEMGHSTARELGRDVSAYATDPRARAEEELVAELSSAFVSADLGMDAGGADDPAVARALENHSAYIQSWAQLVRDDPDALARAASQASRAADAIEAHLPAGRVGPDAGEGGGRMGGETERERGGERGQAEARERRAREGRMLEERRRRDERGRAAQRCAAQRGAARQQRPRR